MDKELEKNLDQDLVLDEAKATGEDSENMDPVTPAGGSPKGKNRKADLNKAADPKAAKVADEGPSKGTNDEGLKEAVSSLFEGEELSEDFKTKTIAIFEAAVQDKASAIRTELEEKFDADLTEQTEQAVNDLVEKVDTYLDYVIEQWVAQNEVAIESNFKVEVAESLFDGIKSLVTEHNLEVDDETKDAIAEMEEKLEEQNSKYNEMFEAMASIKEEKEALERDVAFNSLSEGLTDTQVEKLRTLSEGVSFETTEDFSKKLEVIKESYFAEATTQVEDETEMLEELVEDAPKAPSADPTIAAYADAMARIVKT